MVRRSTMARYVFSVLLALFLSAEVPAQTPPGFEDDLQAGKLGAAERRLQDHLKTNAKDDNARFALGVVRFLQAVEARAQAFYRYGYRTDTFINAQLTNLPIPKNPRPQPLDANGMRAMLKSWVHDLGRVDATLESVSSADVKVTLHFGLLRLDLNGDGTAADDESLWRVYSRFNRQVNVAEADARRFVVAFDRGDVDWLRGYCHLLSALAEVLLAHDLSELFDQVGYLAFSGAKPPATFLAEKKPDDGSMGEILDLITAIHLLRLPVIEPERMKSALGHLESMIVLSRSSWKFILAETDNDAEWIPSPKQKTVASPVQVTQQMVDGWHNSLDEFEAILAGRKLAPFWRGNDPKRGINVRRVFTEPHTFDLVLWVRGTAAIPFLEQGEISHPETWDRLNRIFGGEFIGFAMWFN